MKKKQRKIKIVNIVGTRPNFMKIAPIFKSYSKYPGIIEPILVHTNQHSDNNMSKVFFESLNIPKPKYRLSIKRGSANSLIAQIISGLEKILEKEKPDLVVVVGDVNSTMASAVSANKMKVPVAHVEAGLRSGDRDMPEEINRIITDHIADFLFVTEQSGIKNLTNEGIPSSRIFFTGNVMIDNLITMLPKIQTSTVLDQHNIKKNEYVIMTMHRPATVDTKIGLQTIIRLIKAVINATDLSIVFPIHPRTLNNLTKHKLLNRLQKMDKLIVTEPKNYIDFMNLVQNSRFVLTDSGGIQEEAAYIKIPAITLRTSTERPSTIECGSNRLHHPWDIKGLVGVVKNIINTKSHNIKDIPMNDGKASERIVKIIIDKFQ